MKKSIKIICFLLFANCLVHTARAQALTDSVSVIMSPGAVNAKTVSEIKASIKALSGTRVIGYCSNHNVFLLYIDKKVYGSVTEFCARLRTITGVQSIVLKKGSVNDLLNSCYFSDAEDTAEIKAKLDK